MGWFQLASQCRRALLHWRALDLIWLNRTRNGQPFQRVSERPVMAESCRIDCN